MSEVENGAEMAGEKRKMCGERDKSVATVQSAVFSSLM